MAQLVEAHCEYDATWNLTTEDPDELEVECTGCGAFPVEPARPRPASLRWAAT
jgi:hypothetical protein